jgi:ATP-binding cassette subfamily B protein
MNISKDERRSVVRLMLSFAKWKFGTLIGTIICFVVFASTEPYLIPKIYGRVIDLLQEPHLNTVYNKILVYFLLYIGVWIFSYIAYYLGGFFYSKLIPVFEVKIRELMFNNLQRMHYDYFIQNNEGSLTRVLDIMTSNLTFAFEFLSRKMLPSTIVFIFIMVNFLSTHILIGSILLLWTVIHFSISIVFFSKIQNYSNEQTNIHTKLSAFLVDSFKNQKIKEFFNLHESSMKELDIYQQQDQKNHQKQIFIINNIKILKGFVCILFQGFLLNLLLFKLWRAGAIDMSEFIELLQMNGGVIHLVWHISEKFPEFLYNISKCSSVMHHLDDSNHKFRHHHKLKIINQKGEINIKNLSFSFAKKSIIKNFSLSIKSGSRILIMGYSGIGKSTFVDIISGLLQHYHGDVFFDGVNVKSINRDFFNEYVTFITNTGLFNNTIAYNVTLEKHYDAQKFKKITTSAGLVNLDPNEVLLSSTNNRFSDGEKQRILVARGLWNEHAKIMICDEPFKGLDIKTRRTVSDNLLKATKSKTLIVIDHSLELVNDVDLIIFFGSDQKIHTGTFKELLRQKEYKEFVQNDL